MKHCLHSRLLAQCIYTIITVSSRQRPATPRSSGLATGLLYAISVGLAHMHAEQEASTSSESVASCKTQHKPLALALPLVIGRQHSPCGH